MSADLLTGLPTAAAAWGLAQEGAHEAPAQPRLLQGGDGGEGSLPPLPASHASSLACHVMTLLGAVLTTPRALRVLQMAVDAKAEEQRMAVQKAEEAKKKKEQEEYQAAKKAEKDCPPSPRGLGHASLSN